MVIDPLNRGQKYATPACRTRHYRERREQAFVTSQTRRQTTVLLNLLRERGPIGVHTYELRREHGIGNPSQRRADLEKLGHRITRNREHHGRTPGSRYRLTDDANPRLGSPR
jgi:hypothetical protein